MGTMSAMYEAYWGLREAPFEGAPNPKFLYLSPGHEEALARLVRAVAAPTPRSARATVRSPSAWALPSGCGRPCGTGSACEGSATRCA